MKRAILGLALLASLGACGGGGGDDDDDGNGNAEAGGAINGRAA